MQTCALPVSMAAAQAGEAKPRSARGLVLTRSGLDAVVELLAAAPSAEERAALPGADASRADIILAGAVILEQVVHTLALDEPVVSDYALREGVMPARARECVVKGKRG